MPSFAENGREDHIQNFAISFDQTRQGKIFLVEPHAMPYKSRFACCSVCCSCSTSLLLGYVDVSFVFKLVCPRTKQKRENRNTIMLSSSIFYREDEKADLVIEENTSHSSSSISSKSSNSSDRYGSSFAQP